MRTLISQNRKKPYKWFLHRQQKTKKKKMAISGLMLKTKGLGILNQIKENDHGFQTSYGWLKNFK